MKQTKDLAQRLTTVVQAVPGVSAIYRSTPILTTVIATVVDLVAPGQAPPLVLVETQADDVTISATIGVAEGESAPVICGTVHDIIAAYLAKNGVLGQFTIRVTVASVSG